ncbi:MAG: patatin-like phospholipase family protein [Candidatus Halalkalibacterium sp. M3_1C_030]
MSGGGARAAYQVGVMRCIARHFPDLEVPLVTGVSAGAINAAHLAGHPDTFSKTIGELTNAWLSLTPEKVFKLDSLSLLKNGVTWTLRLLSGKQSKLISARGLVDSDPLRDYLMQRLQAAEDGTIEGIGQNLENGSLQALAISTTNYLTGQSITWTQGCGLDTWESINQRSKKTHFHVDHIMASAALPIFLPAIQLGDEWHGDGGLRLYAPLSPAVHLGADKILAISTRYNRTEREEHERLFEGYPPPAQIFGIVLNSIFLDLLEQDAYRMKTINNMLQKIPEKQRGKKRIIDLFTMRPSRDIGKLASDFEKTLPAPFRYLLRGQGVHELQSPDWLSMILFHPEYISKLIEIGEKDADKNLDELKRFLQP